METSTKGIICRHFWHVMLYSNEAKFHISIIPIRWYRDDILLKFDNIVENSPVLIAIESSTPCEVNFTLKSLRHMQGQTISKTFNKLFLKEIGSEWHSQPRKQQSISRWKLRVI